MAHSFQNLVESLLDTYGEAVDYVPADGSEREIMAVVDRNPPAPEQESNSPGVRPKMTITVANRTTAHSDYDPGGIGATELDTGRDEIRVAPRAGGTATLHAVRQIAEQTPAHLVLEIT